MSLPAHSRPPPGRRGQPAPVGQTFPGPPGAAVPSPRPLPPAFAPGRLRDRPRAAGAAGGGGRRASVPPRRHSTPPPGRRAASPTGHSRVAGPLPGWSVPRAKTKASHLPQGDTAAGAGPGESGVHWRRRWCAALPGAGRPTGPGGPPHPISATSAPSKRRRTAGTLSGSFAYMNNRASLFSAGSLAIISM